MKYLLCINTSARPGYRRALAALRSEPWFRALAERPDVEIVEVRATGAASPALRDGVLELPCPDDYGMLARKTLEMFRFFHARGGFDYLVKMDDTIAGSYLKKRLERGSLETLCRGKYNGVQWLVSHARMFRAWEKKHGLRLGDVSDQSGIPFCAGKCYACSAEACRVIAERGGESIDRFERLGGVEDVFVGAVLRKHCFSPGERFRNLLRGVAGQAATYARVALGKDRIAVV